MTTTLIDGFRSTVFEYDMQLFFIQFIVEGAVISNVETYFARIEMMDDIIWIPSYNETKIVTTKIPKYKLERVYDPAVENAFREKYTPKATIRRIKQ
jgi:hypothetical protein